MKQHKLKHLYATWYITENSLADWFDTLTRDAIISWGYDHHGTTIQNDGFFIHDCHLHITFDNKTKRFKITATTTKSVYIPKGFWMSPFDTDGSITLDFGLRTNGGFQ